MKRLSLFKCGVITACFVWALVFLVSGSSVQAMSTTVVNTTAVADDKNDGNCDLWEALQAIADFNNGADTDSDGSYSTYHECATATGPHFIVFSGSAAGGTISMNPNLSPVLPWVTDDVTITGPVVIDGGGSAVDESIFHTNVGGKLTLVNLVVQNGYTSGGGGAILSQGSQDVINIIGSSFINNKAENRGGAINVSGELNILASNFSGNKALGLDGNGTDYEGHGGAIYKSGYRPINISLSNFAGNIATEGGGAIFNSGADSGEISDTVFNGNIVNDDAPTSATLGGGAIFNQGNDASDGGLVIKRSVFNGNLSFDGEGGAIFNGSNGFLHIYDSSFNANVTGDLSTAKMGGAIYNWKELDIRRVTFAGNISLEGNGGAIANDRSGDAYVANSTFIANLAPMGDGGAIWNGNTNGTSASEVFLYNDTFSLNVSPNAGATFFNQPSSSHDITLRNTIVEDSGNPADGDTCNELLTSQGNNIDSGNTCGFTQGSDLPNTDPMLATPSYNGGPLASLLTMALLAGSPAIDAGDNTTCANMYVESQDQRGDPRPKGSACDIGAFETDPLIPVYGSNPVQPGPIHIGNTSAGVAITNTFTILSVGNAPLEVSNPSFGGTNADEFAVQTAFPLNISDGDSAQVVLICLGNAVGDHTATLTLDTNVPTMPSVTYDLTCHVEPMPTAGFSSDPIAPGPLDFGNVFVGNSADRPLRFMETGNATLMINSIALSGAHAGDFMLDTTNIVLNDGDPAVIRTVTCAPTNFGLRTATLSLVTNDPIHPSVSYNLICEGLPVPPPPLGEPGISYIDEQGGLTTLGGAYDIAISPDGNYAYVTSIGDDTLTVFSRDEVMGELTYVMSTPVDLTIMNDPYMVEVSPDGTQVYVTAGTSDTFLVYERDLNSGMVTLPPTVFENNVNGVTDLNYPYGIVATDDGRFIYVTNFHSSSIVIFTRDENGVVSFGSSLVDNVNLALPYVPALSPDGKHIYVTGGHTGGSTNVGYVTAYARNVVDGSLSFVQTMYEGGPCAGAFCPADGLVDGLGRTWGIDISPDGLNIYVASYFDDAVVRLIRNSFDGTFTYGGYLKDGLPRPEAATQTAAAMMAEGLNGAISVKVSPDGQYVYVTGYESDSLAVFARNSNNNGSLLQVQTIYDNVDAPALNGAREIGLSPDGTAVYIGSSVSSAVVALHTANPVATLYNLLPASAQAGSGTMVVRVQGENFVPGAVARVNGNDRATEFISPDEVEVEILASDLAAAGSRTIDVVNPEPGGGVSNNSLNFTVTAPNENPVPSIDYLQPQGAAAGEAALTLKVNGYNFINSSKVHWNGTERATTFVGSNQLEMTVTAQDLLSPGTAVVTVVTLGPGGGTSNAVAFDVAAPGQNPVPTILSIDPTFTIARGAGSPALAVHITGEHFILGVKAQWNGEFRPTQFVSETEIIVTLSGLDVAYGGVGSITAVNPAPGGGTSNPATFTIFPYVIYVPFVMK